MTETFSKLGERLFGNQKVKNTSYSLSQMLLRSALLVYLLFALVFTSIQVVIEYYAIKQDITQQLQSLAQTFEPAASSALWNLDTKLLKSVVDGMGASQIVVRVEVVDLDNTVKVLWRDDSQTAVHSELNVERKLYHRDKDALIHLGNLHVSSSKDVLFSLLTSRMQSVVISDLILFFSFCLLMWLFIRFLVVKPLVLFSNQMVTLSKPGQGLAIDFGETKVKEIKSLQESLINLCSCYQKEKNLFGTRRIMIN